jgi:hypothetical protein
MVPETATEAPMMVLEVRMMATGARTMATAVLAEDMEVLAPWVIPGLGLRDQTEAKAILSYPLMISSCLLSLSRNFASQKKTRLRCSGGNRVNTLHGTWNTVVAGARCSAVTTKNIRMGFLTGRARVTMRIAANRGILETMASSAVAMAGSPRHQLENAREIDHSTETAQNIAEILESVAPDEEIRTEMKIGVQIEIRIVESSEGVSGVLKEKDATPAKTVGTRIGTARKRRRKIGSGKRAEIRITRKREKKSVSVIESVIEKGIRSQNESVAIRQDVTASARIVRRSAEKRTSDPSDPIDMSEESAIEEMPMTKAREAESGMVERGEKIRTGRGEAIALRMRIDPTGLTSTIGNEIEVIKKASGQGSIKMVNTTRKIVTEIVSENVASVTTIEEAR